MKQIHNEKQSQRDNQLCRKGETETVGERESEEDGEQLSDNTFS